MSDYTEIVGAMKKAKDERKQLELGEKPMSNGRFDYVKYDRKAQNQQTAIKEMCESLEEYINKFISDGRAKSLAFTSLEEFYMWCGKAIRDEQIKRAPAP